MKAILRVIRVLNLFIVLLTMSGVAFYLLKTYYYQPIDFSYLYYALLIISTMIIAAAGNMINDYFDVKADRINKPDKLVISKYIKKKKVIVIHWFLNVIAAGISVLLTIKYNSFLFLFVHLAAMNLLWFYSAYFKKKLLVGNLVIAGLTSLVPLLSVWFFKAANESAHPYSPYHAETWSVYLDYSFVYFTVFCAFFENLAREISKDIQDVTGDKLIHVVSLPMKIGVKKAGWIAILLLQIPTFAGIYVISQQLIPINLVSMILLGVCAALNFSCIVFTFIHKEFPFQIVNTVIKWSMLIGVTTFFTNTL